MLHSSDDLSALAGLVQSLDAKRKQRGCFVCQVDIALTAARKLFIEKLAERVFTKKPPHSLLISGDENEDVDLVIEQVDLLAAESWKKEFLEAVFRTHLDKDEMVDEEEDEDEDEMVAEEEVEDEEDEGDEEDEIVDDDDEEEKHQDAAANGCK